MSVIHRAATCRWATATLHMPAPLWLESWDRPWTCLCGAAPRALPTTDVCASCPRWQSNGLRKRGAGFTLDWFELSVPANNT
jgi:hypothetical protein